MYLSYLPYSFTDKQGPIMGWDLFGRVPYDDWLFSTSRLIRPDLLRRSYVEAVSGDNYGDNRYAISV